MKITNNCTLLKFTSSIVFLLLYLSACHTTRNTGNKPLDKVVASSTDNKNNATQSATNNSSSSANASLDTLVWCDTLVQRSARKIIVCFQKIGSTVKADTIGFIEINPDAIFSSTIIDSTIQKKLAYRVAILLPFMSKGFKPAASTEISSRSIKSVEFYEGVLMALDSLKAEGVSLFVNVFDSQRDSTAVRDIFNKRTFQEADLIIGPLNTALTKIVADYAKANGKAMISPFNTRDDLTRDNPYFIQVNPTFEVHSDLIVQQMYRLERNKKYIDKPMEKNFFVLGLDQDSVRIQQLQSSFANYNNDQKMRMNQLVLKSPTIDIENIQPKLNKDKLNIILIPSYQNEGFVYNALREIQKLVDKVEPKKGYQIVIIGMDRWRYYSRINFEYFESMNVHLTSPFYIDLDRAEIQKFKSDYKAVYGIGTRQFGIIGFDVMLYFGRMMHLYGTNFQAHLWKHQAAYKHTQFQIEADYIQLPAIDASSSSNAILRNYENKFLHFLQFKNYRLNRAN